MSVPTETAKCAGKCEVTVTSWLTGEPKNAGRNVLGCSRVWESVPVAHDEHDWFDRHTGRNVHCYGHRPTLAPDMFVMARRGIACVRLLPTVDVTMCGRLGDGPAEFRNPRSPRYVTDQCAACDAAYSAQHGHLPRVGLRA